MKKIPNRMRLYQKKRQIRSHKTELRSSNIHRNIVHKKKRFIREHREILEIITKRSIFRKKHYRKKFNEKPKTVYIDGDFGVEDFSRVDYFFEKTAEIIDFNNKELTIDFNRCTWIWPSAITMLCSLKQWVELSVKNSAKYSVPQIRSTDSNDNAVNSYLEYCGFYDYVNRLSSIKINNEFKDEEIVKIRRETKPNAMEKREDEIVELLKRNSNLNENQIELFNCVVLTEILNNVTEHGVSHIDKGWWVLAQHHKNHGFISLCIADNGIGIRNVLMTGPQKAEIIRKIKNEPTNDHLFIRTALTEQVSGAFYASQKTKKKYILKKVYERGAHRGNGLKRVMDACNNLSIPFSILSQHGYAFIDKNGKIIKNDSISRRIFAGTLHHFLIPAKKEQKNAEND